MIGARTRNETNVESIFFDLTRLRVLFCAYAV